MTNKDYKRLTIWNEELQRPCMSADSSNEQTVDIVARHVDRLYELENSIENGTLVFLPCKVGDTVYCLIAQGRYGTVYTTGEAIARVVSKIIWDGNRFEIYSDRPHYWSTDYNECNFYGYWEDSVFATKDAAEAHLKELRGKKQC